MAHNTITKNFYIDHARKHTGWSYSEMKWLSEAEAEKANRTRKDLLQTIADRVNHNFLGNKISSGKLSPGCLSCGQGTWSCLFIGSSCTANCFFCPQDRKKKKDLPPVDSGILFDKPEDYVDYLEKYNIKGIGFSGGESFLHYEKLLTYIIKIRETLGHEIYIWIYTNGDLIDKNKLKALKDAGLNEIRFNIAARKYDLKAVKMAAGIMDTVTVEIPMIPEDYEIMKKCLPQIQAIGVAHLNLHQLIANQYCYKQLINRGYTFLHQFDIPVLESEITALKLIQYSLDHNIKLPINYCSAIYKHRFQHKAYRKRFQSFVKKRYEGLTESGFIRRLAIHDNLVKLRNIVKVFQENKWPDSMWLLNEENSELFFHHSLLKDINFNKHGLILRYYAPLLIPEYFEDNENSKLISLNSSRNICVGKKLEYETHLSNPVTINGFREIFIEKKNVRNVFKRFYTDYPLKNEEDVDVMMNEKEQLNFLNTYEFIGGWLDKIY